MPANASAVILNVTADAAAGDGFVTVHPTGTGPAQRIEPELPAGPDHRQRRDRTCRCGRSDLPLHLRRDPPDRRRRRLAHRSASSRDRHRCPADPPPQFPAQRASLEQGGATWVVVLAGSPEFDDPVLAQAVTSAEVGGYSAGWTDCDVGASEALGFPADEHVYTVSVYFETESDAQLALAAFRSHAIDGVVAVVETFCLD